MQLLDRTVVSAKPTGKAPGLPKRGSTSSLDCLQKRTSDGISKKDIWKPSLPRDAEELIRPLNGVELPEEVRRYLSLLADSSNSNGSMMKHLIKLIAKGAVDTSKLHGLIQNPLDSAVDAAADISSELILAHVADIQEHARGGKERRHTESGAADAGVPAKINPVQEKVLSMLLSMMMSGAAAHAGVADAMPAQLAAHMPTFAHEASHVAKHAGSDMSFFGGEAKFAMAEAPSFASLRAPSLAAHTSFSGMSGILGTGGMATSTALKMLRADSKRDAPDLSKVFDTILDTVSESMDGAHGHSHLRQISQRSIKQNT